MTVHTGDAVTDDLITYADRPVWLREARSARRIDVAEKARQATVIPCEIAGVKALILLVPSGEVEAWMSYLDGAFPGRLRGLVGGS